MSNEYYTQPPDLAPDTKARSLDINTLAASVMTAFDKVPGRTPFYIGTQNYAVDTGILNALVATINTAVTALADGMEVVVRAAVTPTAAATLAVTGLTAFGLKNITRADGSAMIGGEWVAGQFVGFRYRAATDTWQMDVIASTSPTSGLPTTGGTMTGQLKFAKGIAVVAAATVNLDSATGNDFHMTGNTPITAFTIAAGQLLKVIVDGTPLITYNATSLKVPGLANIQCAVGDNFWIMGDGAGNAIITDYTYANGNAATSAQIKTGTDVLKTLTPAATLAAQGFTAYAQTADQVITAAGSLTIAHGLGRVPVLVLPFLKNVTAQANYVTGEIVPTEWLIGSSSGVSYTCDATNITVRFGSNANTFAVTDKTTGSDTAITNANWKLFLRAWA